MHPSHSFLTDARTFMPRAGVWCSSGGAPGSSRRGARTNREVRAFGTEANERARAVGADLRARALVAVVRRSKLPRRGPADVKNMLALFVRRSVVSRWGCVVGGGRGVVDRGEVRSDKKVRLAQTG